MKLQSITIAIIGVYQSIYSPKLESVLYTYYNIIVFGEPRLQYTTTGRACVEANSDSKIPLDQLNYNMFHDTYIGVIGTIQLHVTIIIPSRFLRIPLKVKIRGWMTIDRAKTQWFTRRLRMLCINISLLYTIIIIKIYAQRPSVTDHHLYSTEDIGRKFRYDLSKPNQNFYSLT